MIIVDGNKAKVLLELQTKEDEKEIKKIVNLESNNNILSIPKISLEKPVYNTEYSKSQNIIDNNNLVSLYEYSEKGYTIYGHYTDTYNLVFNRIPELVKSDSLYLKINNKQIAFEVLETGIIERNKSLSLEKRNTITIITCTKNYDKELYYYVQGVLKEK
ncbi:sortase [Mycoplasma sp. P36-A1]|uniref:sortase n=1 Tax=Mycoplasma sp. P36-A1 TaxID=3252900 RepID=UPI003C2DFF75